MNENTPTEQGQTSKDLMLVNDRVDAAIKNIKDPTLKTLRSGMEDVQRAIMDGDTLNQGLDGAQVNSVEMPDKRLANLMALEKRAQEMCVQETVEFVPDEARNELILAAQRAGTLDEATSQEERAYHAARLNRMAENLDQQPHETSELDAMIVRAMADNVHQEPQLTNEEELLIQQQELETYAALEAANDEREPPEAAKDDLEFEWEKDDDRNIA